MLLALLGGVSAGAWADDYELYSGDLTEGDYIIYYSGKAMNTTTSSNRLQYAEVTPTNNIISTTNTAIVWHIASSGDYWTIYNAAGKVYAAATGTKNQATTATTTSDKTLWTVSGTSTYEFVNKNNSANSVNANLRNNGSYGFACYATSTGGALSLYKKASHPVTGVSLNKSATTLEVGDEEILTATISPSNADNKNVSWSSDDEDVATVNSNGKITAVAAGTANITVTTEDGSKTATCAVTVTAATKTAVNMTGFSATSTTIVKGNTTTTSVTNDQAGWTAAYTYSSSDETVATVATNGVITAVKKGSATITATLNVSPSDETYKAGTTTSKTIDITVTNPFHNVTFSSNGSTYSGPTSVEEGESISLPAVNPDDVNGYTFQGWKVGTISGTTDDEPEYISSPVMGDADVTYYAVFAEEETSYSESETEKTQTLQYDTWTYSGSTANKNSYRLFGNNSYIESAAFDLSLLKQVKVYGGTFGGDSYKNFTIGDGTNTWKTGELTGNGNSKEHTVTGGTALSGTKKLYITSNSGDASNSGLRISKVEIYTKKRTTTYSNYCTTVSALPRPVITMADVDMTWGDADKYVVPTATVGEEAYDGSFSYSVDKDGLTVASDGKLTSSTPGTYVVTASIVATEDYQAASTTCTVTVGKQDVTLAFADATVRKKTSDASYTQTATATPAAYDGTIAYSKESASTSAGATVNSSTGAVSFSATGSVIVKATAPATAKYNAAETTYTILIQTDPEILVEDVNIAYGKTYTIDDDLIEGGDITVTSSNTAVATVDGLVITGLAVGTTTITVATAESDTYVAGEETFTLTVTAPTGASEKPSADPVSVFYESFDNCAGSGGNDDIWSGISQGSTLTVVDNSGWSFTTGNGASECARFGTSSSKGSAETPSITLEDGITYTLTFKAGAWNGKDEATTLQLSATNATLKNAAGNAALSSVTMTKGSWTTYTATVTGNSDAAKIKFEGNAASNSRFFLDEVKITKPGTAITATSVTTTGGLATYCYQYPLDLDGIEGAKAYKVSSVDVENSKVIMEQITGSIKGGVPFILKSDGDDATFEIPLADASTTAPDDNALVGTLAPTFVAQTSGDYTNFAYSKSNECFVKLADAGNTVPANRAYLPINLGSGSGVKAFTLFFDDTATGIGSMDRSAEGRFDTSKNRQLKMDNEKVIYNLAGQRMSKMQKGINIVNGRKVLVQSNNEFVKKIMR